jgi:D-alanyl-D-alanine carboxypeptidase (penicillin-binding protein 5/6)
MKNSEKFIFLFVVIGAIFFARTMYPKVSGVPLIGRDDVSQTAIAQTQIRPPVLILPQTSIASADSANGDIRSTSSQQIIKNANTAFSQTGNALVPSFDRKAYLIADLSTGAMISGSNIASRWPTASLTKLMTATVILDTISTSTQITVTQEMFNADPQEQTLVVGGTYNVEDLLHGMLMPSSNVAAETIADYIGRAKFMQEMNQRAQEWGMKDTYFDDPSGISAANQSTANDLMILAQHVYINYPQILAITDIHQIGIIERTSGKKVSVTSINDFAGTPNFIGGKTGHTDQAGGNLLSIFNYDGHPVIMIILDTVDRFGNTSKLLSWFKANFK